MPAEQQDPLPFCRRTRFYEFIAQGALPVYKEAVRRQGLPSSRAEESPSGRHREYCTLLLCSPMDISLIFLTGFRLEIHRS